MSSPQERVNALAQEMMKAMKEAKAAEARAMELGEAVMKALADVKAEAEAARNIVEYPSGRYECKSCGHGVLFTEASADLPACGNCGSREYDGPEPKVTIVEPPPPKEYPAGLYECTACGAIIAVAVETDTLSPCEICGAGELKTL